MATTRSNRPAVVPEMLYKDLETIYAFSRLCSSFDTVHPRNCHCWISGSMLGQSLTGAGAEKEPEQLEASISNSDASLEKGPQSITK